ncbi:MAG: putative metal-binding motif-containing protein [Saprospiraceae bacterium]|nr:putative metal-binding motif-containing protein [Saprospiraceae bacterium]
MSLSGNTSNWISSGATINEDCTEIPTEVCNGLDDNCNGQIDEGFDQDGDGFTICQNDCDDNDPAINPSATETCNELDDDCDGITDGLPSFNNALKLDDVDDFVELSQHRFNLISIARRRWNFG